MKIDKKFISQFLKFAVVGVVNTGIDWVVFFLLTNYVVAFSGGGEVWAKIISFSVAVANSFILNSLWTFKDEFKAGFAKDKAAEKFEAGVGYFGKFIVVSLIGLAINSITFSLFRFSLGSSKVVGLFFASGAAVLWNFFANKFWTYQASAKDQGENKPDGINNRKYNLIAAAILLIAAILCIFSLRGDSGIVDEVAHIPSGYSYLVKQDYRLNPEHPPLGKAIDAVPLLFIKVNNAFSNWSWDGLAQWENGWDFLYHEGNNADKMLFWTRIPTVILFLLIGIYLYKWASELYGKPAGIFALILLAFSPNLLAHARFVTTDIAAALGFIISAYYFYHYYKAPTIKGLIFAGLAFGLAQLLKFSAILLIPTFGLAIIVKAYLDRDAEHGFWHNFWKSLKSLMAIFAIGMVLVWAAYLFFTWNTPLDIERKVIETNLPTAGAAPIRNLLLRLINFSLLKPLAHWLLGVFMVFAHAEGGHTAFLLGKFSRVGWWYFFPAAWFFKEPIPVILLTVWSAIVLFWKRFRDKIDLWQVALFALVIIVYWGISMRGSLNIGVRHLLPTFPFIFLLIARAVKPTLENRWTFAKVALSVLVIWLVAETVFTFPKYLAYFNESRYLLGLKKHEILVDSSLDWGQDLKRLAKFVDDNNISSIKVDYFGGGVPTYYIPGAVEWHSKFGRTTGWLAVSATFYQMSKYYGPQEGQESYAYLDNLKPTAVIGDSILVFDIPNGYSQ